MASNDTAALVVALSAQLTRFEKDMKGATDIADKAVKKIETRFEGMTNVLNNKLQSFGQNAASRFGLIGEALVFLGPAGLAAAVGIGAIIGALTFFSEKTDEFVEKAKKLKDGAETIGITITQLKLLGQVGRTVGLDIDETTAFFTKFIANIEALRKGGGPLYDAILKVDVGLLKQLSTTKDSAEAINLLVAAFAKLQNQTDKLDIARAAGGKAGLVGVRMIDELARQGSLTGLEAKGTTIDENQIERAVRLRREIDAIKSKTANIWGSMFSDDTLQHEKAMAEDLKRIAEFVERIFGAKERSRILDPGQADQIALEGLIARQNQLNKEIERYEFLQQQPQFSDRQARRQVEVLEELRKKYKALQEEADRLRLKMEPGIKPGDYAHETGVAGGDKTKGSPATELELLQRKISLLGEAVKQSELLKQEQLKLAAAVEKDPSVNGIAARALAAFNLAQKAAAVAIRERLAVASEQQIVDVRLAQLQQDKIKFNLKENEVQAATVVILREAKLAAEALAVRRAYLPGLKQLEFDAQSLSKNLDTLSTTSLNNLTSSLVDITSGTVGAKEGFKNLGLQVVRSLQEMIIKMTIIAPLAKSLQSSLFGVFGGGFEASYGTPDKLFPGYTGNASGTDNWRGGMTWVGERGPELVNLPRGSQVIPNDVARNISSGGVNVTYAPMIDLSGADSSSVARLEALFAQHKRELPGIIVTTVNDARRRSVRV